MKDVITENYQLMFGDCLERMKEIPSGSVDLVLTDPPYQSTALSWDSMIPFKPMWAELKRIIKPNGACVLFSSQPFTTNLIYSNMKCFKYSMVWKKSKCGSPLTAKYKPLTKHEDINVFSLHKKTLKYYPQMSEGKPYKRKFTENKVNNMGFGIKGVETDNNGTRHPTTILDYPQQWRRQDQVHPTQKPVELMEFLIKSFSMENETVLDFTAGSFSTGVACVNTNRRFIGIEMEEKYFNIGVNRMCDTNNHCLNKETK